MKYQIKLIDFFESLFIFSIILILGALGVFLMISWWAVMAAVILYFIHNEIFTQPTLRILGQAMFYVPILILTLMYLYILAHAKNNLKDGVKCKSTEQSQICTFGVDLCCFDCDKRNLSDFCKSLSDDQVCEDSTCKRWIEKNHQSKEDNTKNYLKLINTACSKCESTQCQICRLMDGLEDC